MSTSEDLESIQIKVYFSVLSVNANEYNHLINP